MTRILVIEDSPAIREEVTCALTFEGYETKSAGRAADGLKLATGWQPDLIICDILLPQGSGYEVLEKVRSRGELQTLPFIFLTAKSERADVRFGMNSGADDYITKPFRLDELVASVKCQLSKRANLLRGMELSYVHDPGKTRDRLTGLPGRPALRQDLTNHMASGHQPLCLMVIDIDNYRGLRDAFDCDEAGRIVREAADRISGMTNATIYRTDSDSFALTTTDFEHKRDLTNLAAQLLRKLNAPFQSSLGHCYLDVSLGISKYPQPSSHADALISNAEFAADQAKQSGRGYYRVYRPERLTGAQGTLAVETHLRLAQQRRELLLHYQPKIDLEGHNTFGVEALIRWQSPDLGFLGPESFLPVSADLGLLAAFSNWALQEACRETAELHQRGFKHLTVAVNTAARQLLDPNFPEHVKNVLNETGLPPHHLELEITENVMLANERGLNRRLAKLKDLGVSLSLDDFGIGYSSLAHLQRFPVDVLKIDRSFIQGLTKTSTDDAIVISVLEMARKLNLRVIAEGVETVEQLQFLKRHGCDGVQGYLFCRPLAAEDLLGFLNHPHGAGCPACDPDRWAACRLAGLGIGCPPP